MKTREIAAPVVDTINRASAPDQFYTRVLNILLNIWRAMT